MPLDKTNPKEQTTASDPTPLVSNRRRLAKRINRSEGGENLTRAAASSIANGKPGDRAKLEKGLEAARQSLSNASGASVWLEGWVPPVGKAVEEALTPNSARAAGSAEMRNEGFRSR